MNINCMIIFPSVFFVYVRFLLYVVTPSHIKTYMIYSWITLLGREKLRLPHFVIIFIKVFWGRSETSFYQSLWNSFEQGFTNCTGGQQQNNRHFL